MNGKTAKLIRKAANSLMERGVIKKENLKKAIRRVKKDYLKKTDTQRVMFKRSLIEIPLLSPQEISNNFAPKVS